MFWLDQRACVVRPKQPDFGYSGAEFPRAYAGIPFEDVGRVASSFPTYLGKIEVTLVVGYAFLGLRKALLCVQRLIIIYKRRQSSVNSLTKFA